MADLRDLAFELGPHASVVFRRADLACADLNLACAQLVGLARADIIDRPLRDVFGPELAAFAADGGPGGLELAIVTRGGTRRTAWVTVVGFERDGVAYGLASLVDVSQPKQVEAAQYQAQKLESLGLLAGGIAHDFNNMLSVIGANLNVLVESLAPTRAETAEIVHDMEDAIGRASTLTRQLLAYSRKQVFEPIVIDLNTCVRDARKLLARIVNDDLQLATSLEPELRYVRGDPGYILQILMNLVVNARDAMPRGGTVEIETRNDPTRDEAVLVVRDRGLGMSPEVLARVFEPFFTTKPVGQGTGMGLAVVQGIVAQLGGRIEIASEVGVGTTVRVAIPAATGEAPAREAPRARVATGVETLLVVDDDDHVRRATARALRLRGYTVHEAASGRLALVELLRDPSIAMLVTDVVMPAMDGRQLVQIALHQRPTLKVLFISGYADNELVRRDVALGHFQLLEKPFRVDALAAAVRQVLDA